MTIPMHGMLNYMSSSLPSTLHRNGQLYTARGLDGIDNTYHGLVYAPTRTLLLNGRGLPISKRKTINRNGFELCEAPLPAIGIDLSSHTAIVQKYYKICEGIVAKAIGASHVFAFDHNLRSAGSEPAPKTPQGTDSSMSTPQQVQKPVTLVHGDYTLTSGRERLQLLTQPPKQNDTYATILPPNTPLISPEIATDAIRGLRRFAIVNVWRNTSPNPVQTHPLALCDARTVSRDDMLVFEVHYADRIGENYLAKNGEKGKHAWYIFPEMTRDEVVLLKTWDSAGCLAASDGMRGDDVAVSNSNEDTFDNDMVCTFALHSAVEVEGTPKEAEQRRSIEVRCMALFD